MSKCLFSRFAMDNVLAKTFFLTVPGFGAALRWVETEQMDMFSGMTVYVTAEKEKQSKP